MSHQFERGRRYRVTFLPAGARTRTRTFEGNYLGGGSGEHQFDLRPESGTSSLRDESIREVKDIGPAVWAR
jgi:hypothetical protein